MTQQLFVDTHCHLNFDAYDEDREAVIERAAAAGVGRIIIPATDLETTRQALALAEQYSGVFAAVGVHPNSTATFETTMIDTLRELAQHSKVVAVGEIGLDYYWDHSTPEQQKVAFAAQLDLARSLVLPVIIHNREASEDVMAQLELWVRDLPPGLAQRPGVLHSFSASSQIAQRALAAGFYLGFTGPVTFKNADDLRAVAREVPADRILIETDGPFLTPQPYRGKRNEPAYVVYVADRLAALHGLPTEIFAAQTTANAERLFALPPGD